MTTKKMITLSKTKRGVVTKMAAMLFSRSQRNLVNTKVPSKRI